MSTAEAVALIGTDNGQVWGRKIKVYVLMNITLLIELAAVKILHVPPEQYGQVMYIMGWTGFAGVFLIGGQSLVDVMGHWVTGKIVGPVTPATVDTTNVTVNK